MRVAALYDIHGNLPALEAVMAEVRRADVDHIVVGGDVVPGPMPAEAMDYLTDLDLPVQFIRGNGDREILAQMRGVPSEAVPEAFREAMRWSAQQLSPAHEQALADWPDTARLSIEGLGDVLFCHATPRDDNEIFTRRTPEERLLPIFDGLGASLIVCGHTHMQFDRAIGATRVVNAGSVGMPFGAPGAYWLLLGAEAEFRHTAYDLDDAARRARRSAYPQAEQFAAANILKPPSEAQMLEVFSNAELS